MNVHKSQLFWWLQGYQRFWPMVHHLAWPHRKGPIFDHLRMWWGVRPTRKRAKWVKAALWKWYQHSGNKTPSSMFKMFWDHEKLPWWFLKFNFEWHVDEWWSIPVTPKIPKINKLQSHYLFLSSFTMVSLLWLIICHHVITPNKHGQSLVVHCFFCVCGLFSIYSDLQHGHVKFVDLQSHWTSSKMLKFHSFFYVYQRDPEGNGFIIFIFGVMRDWFPSRLHNHMGW